MSHQVWLFTWILDFNAGSQACTASALSAAPSPILVFLTLEDDIAKTLHRQGVLEDLNRVVSSDWQALLETYLVSVLLH